MSTKDEIFEAVKTGPETVAALVESTGKSESTVRKALKELEADGLVERHEDGGWSAREHKARANHGYARNTASKKDADARDAAIVKFFEGTEGTVRLADVAEGLSITVRAARHGVWRLKNAGTVEQPERGQYQLVES